MPQDADPNYTIAQAWCAERGWDLIDEAGRGGTAPVYGVRSADGERALKIYDEEFSTGERSHLQKERVELQVALGDHDCPSLIKVYEGGTFRERLYVLMNRAPGKELEKVLPAVPREQIRHVVDQVARAALFLRKNGFTHRDIKSANVFVTEDCQTVTLLDVSTIRDIHDPVGLGTDHGDQLPVVATARYSPPEYLFRLIEPGEELWSLVDTYQLGALLHDLIMRRPMFSEEYAAAKENRYRFAHIVATRSPPVKADDVDADLVFLARRALVRDWTQRRDLTLESFLADRKTRQTNALSMIGFGRSNGRRRRGGGNDYFRRLQEIARTMEADLTVRLREEGVTAERTVEPTENRGMVATFRWNTPLEEGSARTTLEVRLHGKREGDKLRISGQTLLEGPTPAGLRAVSLPLPVVADAEDAGLSVARYVMMAMGDLAVMLAGSAEEAGEE